MLLLIEKCKAKHKVDLEYICLLDFKWTGKQSTLNCLLTCDLLEGQTQLIPSIMGAPFAYAYSE